MFDGFFAQDTRHLARSVESNAVRGRRQPRLEGRLVRLHGLHLRCDVARGANLCGARTAATYSPFFHLVFPAAVAASGCRHLTHLISDYRSGLFEGFRYTNTWLVQLTGDALPHSFYVGDVLGSFNSWLRLLSGLSFGGAVVGFLFPNADSDMRNNANLLRQKLSAHAERQHIEIHGCLIICRQDKALPHHRPAQHG
ncbi:MAG: hypothetical protein K8J31_08410 [Anaerolineae bacterium]|nr:hypothetical protein [Anaerolineae bacterium]